METNEEKMHIAQMPLCMGTSRKLARPWYGDPPWRGALVSMQKMYSIPRMELDHYFTPLFNKLNHSLSYLFMHLE